MKREPRPGDVYRFADVDATLLIRAYGEAGYLTTLTTARVFGKRYKLVQDLPAVIVRRWISRGDIALQKTVKTSWSKMVGRSVAGLRRKRRQDDPVRDKNA